jgi:hypothetical protein
MPGDGHHEHVVIQRILTRPVISVQVDDNGIVHLVVGDANDEGHVEVFEDFIVVPEMAEMMGDGLFKAAQTAKPRYAAYMEAHQHDEGPDAPV